jgi:hypothetical protein
MKNWYSKVGKMNKVQNEMQNKKLEGIMYPKFNKIECSNTKCSSEKK